MPETKAIKLLLKRILKHMSNVYSHGSRVCVQWPTNKPLFFLDFYMHEYYDDLQQSVYPKIVIYSPDMDLILTAELELHSSKMYFYLHERDRLLTIRSVLCSALNIIIGNLEKKTNQCCQTFSDFFYILPWCVPVPLTSCPWCLRQFKTRISKSSDRFSRLTSII